MAIPGVLTRSILLDFIILIVEGLTVLFVKLWGVATEKGFSCSDASIRMPYRPDTISTLVLGIAFLVGGLILMAMVELLLSPGGYTPSTVRMRGRALPVWMVQLYRSAVTFLCGAALSQMITDIGKYHVGALRPHFFSVCVPDVDCSSRDGFDPFSYIADYQCLGGDKELIQEARVSFPSGHANLSFYCSTFLAFYLQARLAQPSDQKNSPPPRNLACFLARPVLQGMTLLAAWYTTVSRMMDNMHHPRDIAVGGISGAIAAILIIRGLRPFRGALFLQPNEETPLRQVQPSDGNSQNHDRNHHHPVTVHVVS